MRRFHMKGFVLFLVIVIFVSFGVGTLITLLSSGGIFFSQKNTIKVNEVSSAAASGVKEIKVDTSSTDINLIPQKRSGIQAILKGSITSSSSDTKPELIMDGSSDSINISIKQPHLYFGFINMNLTLDIYVPEDYSNSLRLNTSSGDITIKGSMKLDALDCETSSGTVNIASVTCNTFSHSSSSGDLSAKSIISNSSKIGTSSGEITIDEFTGNLVGNSSSGDISIRYSQFNNNVDLESSSGEIQVGLPPESQFSLDASTSSGDIKCDFPITISDKNNEHNLIGIVGSSKNTISISTSSGDISVTK